MDVGWVPHLLDQRPVDRPPDGDRAAAVRALQPDDRRATRHLRRVQLRSGERDQKLLLSRGGCDSSLQRQRCARYPAGFLIV